MRAPRPPAGAPFDLHAGALVPLDAEVLDGEAMVDESAITGESAPVAREPVPGRHSVLAGTRLLSGWLRVRPLAAARAGPGRSLRWPPWWPALTLGILACAVLLTGSWSGPPRAAVVAALAIPVLSLAAGGALARAEAEFWRGLRVLPLVAGALGRAASCDTLLLADGAVDADGRLVAVEFLPLPGVSTAEVAAAAHLAGAADEGLVHSIHVLARSRGVFDASAIGDPLCGTVPEVARQVGLRGGAWPDAARTAEVAAAGRGSRCLAVADGGRPLGLVELRSRRRWPTLEQGIARGLAVTVAPDADRLGAAAEMLCRGGRRFAVAWTGAASPMPPQASFLLASTAWAAASPDAVDLDADVGKLPALILGARRLFARSTWLRAVAGGADALRAAAALGLAYRALHAPAAAGALGLVASALALLGGAAALTTLGGIRRRPL